MTTDNHYWNNFIWNRYQRSVQKAIRRYCRGVFQKRFLRKYWHIEDFTMQRTDNFFSSPVLKTAKTSASVRIARIVESKYIRVAGHTANAKTYLFDTFLVTRFHSTCLRVYIFFFKPPCSIDCPIAAGIAYDGRRFRKVSPVRLFF